MILIFFMFFNNTAINVLNLLFDVYQGLINALQKLAPNAEHRNCARHIYANWKKKFSGPKYKKLF